MGKLIDYIIHLDKHLSDLVTQFGVWSYALLFLIIFAETGLIVVPFLPGDSLLFVLGVLSSGKTSLSVTALFGALTLAAVLGDQVNFRIGRIFGMKLYRNPNSKIFKPSHLEITHDFYARHGHKTVLLARFVPIVRALAPFVAGMGKMQYRDFCIWSVSGVFLWISICLFGGYFFGQIPLVRDHFEIGLLVIIFFSVVPAIFEVIRHRAKRKRAPKE